VNPGGTVKMVDAIKPWILAAVRRLFALDEIAAEIEGAIGVANGAAETKDNSDD
jgi:hypothetical protein